MFQLINTYTEEYSHKVKDYSFICTVGMLERLKRITRNMSTKHQNELLV